MTATRTTELLARLREVALVRFCIATGVASIPCIVTAAGASCQL